MPGQERFDMLSCNSPERRQKVHARSYMKCIDAPGSLDVQRVKSI